MTAIAGLVLAWSLLSGALSQREVTGPIVFVLAGYLLGNPAWGPFPVDIETGAVHTLAEVTLALVLFSDASRVDLRRLRRQVALPARLLGIGLPLTLLLGAAAAYVLLDDPAWSLALFVGAALAPTDAALSAQVIGDERVPRRLRLAVNVESGLNDGIATPVVAVALALAVSDLGLGPGADHPSVGEALAAIVVACVIGVALGVLGAVGVNVAGARGSALPGGRQLAALAVAVGGFALAVAIDGNGFIAAFVAGLAFGHVVDRSQTEDDADGDVTVLPELGGELLALVVWFLFGAALVPLAIEDGGPLAWVYALLSLTLLRMVPVAVALAGAGLRPREVLFLGWFGPRGLASVVFALLALEQLGESDRVGSVVAVVATTVLLSVVLHGVSAGPAARRFGVAGEPTPTRSGERPRRSWAQRTRH
ncbi:NhaP-type Na+/H+ or K+/H+ antiporter [Mumia flava]|uniref:NhaP-type Na+/H+ or K+/H+ antiporter n=1 Tax=Mumia flava TaxID=1348852 RepID=A0A2M9B690_9ACTN|nr:NhaP-type Na+/H+ or K+/H+ antiporter [Mumia flava]